MAKRRTITDDRERVGARVINPPDSQTRERIRNGLDSLREFGELVGGVMGVAEAAEESEERAENPAEDDDQFVAQGPEDTVVWPEIVDLIDVEAFLETQSEIAELADRMDAEDSPDAVRLQAAQHYLALLEDGADDFSEEYVVATWQSWVEKAKDKAPEFAPDIDDFLL